MIGLLLCLLVIPAPSKATVELEKFMYWRSGKMINVPIGQADGVKVNDICLGKQNKCMALKMLHQKSKVRQLKQAIPGNAAGSYCDFLGGAQLFMQRESDKLKSQFCVFNDLTMIDARDLYLRHYKGKSKP